jgi:hypothetical protein
VHPCTGTVVFKPGEALNGSVRISLGSAGAPRYEDYVLSTLLSYGILDRATAETLSMI